MDQAQISYSVLTGGWMVAGVFLLIQDHPLAGAVALGWAIFSHVMIAAVIASEARVSSDDDSDDSGFKMPTP